jgi:hypothetical protein
MSTALAISIHISAAVNFSHISKATTGVPNRETIAEQKCAAVEAGVSPLRKLKIVSAQA